MIRGLGTDIVRVERIRGLMSHGQFLEKYFCPVEIACIGNNPERAAGYFAAKEAFSKALGTGFGKELALKDICVEHDALGRPCITVSSALREKLSARGIETIHLSISHEREYAVAVVIFE